MIIGSSEWKEWRRHKIGASDSAAILGISPHKTRMQLWEEKVLGKDPFLNKAMQRGLEREKEALDWADYTLGMSFNPKIVESDIYEWKFATLDGWDEKNRMALEIKWANKKVHDSAKKGIVIDYYYPQVQSQMVCAGIDEMYFLSCYEEDGKTDFELVLVKRDAIFIEKMMEEERKFYIENMLGMIQPTPYLLDVIKNPDEFDDLCKRYEEQDVIEKEASAKKEEIKKRLFEISSKDGSCSSSYSFRKTIRKGTIGYDSIPELKGVDLESYRKQAIEVWKVVKHD
ncbi:MAG: YqaJ viral recombinase family protein [Patescibacteria group bacterium]|nr:YqaJ viral recombinase family protein [Patescibacteria group bacterium]MDE2438744.1 YqaJ viral recombinase family protein [Patescibacteria group bacterium]